MTDELLPADLPSPLALAFLGDAVYSAHIRRRAVAVGLSKSGDLHDAANLYVTAHAQAQALVKIRPYFTASEEDVCRRASNSTHLKAPKSASVADYRAATGFEAVLGMLFFLARYDRLEELLQKTHD